MVLSEARETDCGAEGMFDASVSELLSNTPDALLFILSALGGDAGCLLKDAKAEVGLQLVWNAHKTVNMNDRNTFPIILPIDEHLLTVLVNQPQIWLKRQNMKMISEGFTAVQHS